MFEISRVEFSGCWRQPLHSTSANIQGLEQQDLSEDFESDNLQTGQSLLQTQSMELVLGGQLRPHNL